MKTKPFVETEKGIQQAIIGYLRMKGYYVQRMNSGAIRTAQGGLVRLNEKGTPDIMAFKIIDLRSWLPAFVPVPGFVNMLFVEVKRPGKKPTPLQMMKMKELEEFGAMCVVATSIDDLKEAGI